MVGLGVFLLLVGIVAFGAGTYIQNDWEIQFAIWAKYGYTEIDEKLITVGAVVALAGLLFIIFGCFKKKRKKVYAPTYVYNVQPPVQQPVQSQIQQPAQTGDTGVVQCQKCGTKLKAGSKFCRNCGSALQAGISCPACGKQLPEGSRFCNGCGTAV